MNRIPLNYTQRQSLQPLRRDIDMKKQLRGKPHTSESSGHQATLSGLKWHANGLYTLIAGARGHEHAPKRTEATLAAMRTAAQSYTNYFRDRRPPARMESLGLLLKEIETKSAPQGPSVAA